MPEGTDKPEYECGFCTSEKPRNLSGGWRGWFICSECVVLLAGVGLGVWVFLPHHPLVPTKHMSVPGLIVATTVVLGALLFLFRETVWGRKNYARWSLFLFFVLPLHNQIKAAVLHPAFPALAPPALQIATQFAVILLQAAAFYFVFTGDAKAWFHQRAK